MTKYLKRRGKSYSFNMRIPDDVKEHFRKKTHITKALGTRDLDLATALSSKMAGECSLRFQALRGSPQARDTLARDTYERTRAAFDDGEIEASDGLHSDPKLLGIELTLDAIADETWRRGVGRMAPLPPDLKAQVDALNDAKQQYLGNSVEPRTEYEPPFSDIAARWIDHKRPEAKKQTIGQYETVVRLFSDYINDKPIRQVRPKDAVGFIDELRNFDPNWGRSPKTKDRSFAELKALYADSGKQLSVRTLNRYSDALQSIWKWAERRDYAAGKNPFEGLHQKITAKNSSSYRAWTTPQLQALMFPPFKPQWMWEATFVALYTGMRSDEICSLRWTNVLQEDGVWFFDIIDAKSPAGVRQVPLHSELEWLLKRRPDDSEKQIWPDAKPGGPDGKHNWYLSKRFTEIRRKRGITDPDVVFHSFRKTVTKMMERNRVPENEWQEIFGHEKGFTYKVYNPDGLSLQHKKSIVDLIEYPELSLRAGLNDHSDDDE